MFIFRSAEINFCLEFSFSSKITQKNTNKAFRPRATKDSILFEQISAIYRTICSYFTAAACTFCICRGPPLHCTCLRYKRNTRLTWKNCNDSKITTLRQQCWQVLCSLTCTTQQVPTTPNTVGPNNVVTCCVRLHGPSDTTKLKRER